MFGEVFEKKIYNYFNVMHSNFFIKSIKCLMSKKKRATYLVM